MDNCPICHAELDEYAMTVGERTICPQCFSKIWEKVMAEEFGEK